MRRFGEEEARLRRFGDGQFIVPADAIAARLTPLLDERTTDVVVPRRDGHPDDAARAEPHPQPCRRSRLYRLPELGFGTRRNRMELPWQLGRALVLSAIALQVQQWAIDACRTHTTDDLVRNAWIRAPLVLRGVLPSAEVLIATAGAI